MEKLDDVFEPFSFEPHPLTEEIVKEVYKRGAVDVEWDDTDESKRVKLEMEVVCSPRSEGGLGLVGHKSRTRTVYSTYEGIIFKYAPDYFTDESQFKHEAVIDEILGADSTEESWI